MLKQAEPLATLFHVSRELHFTLVLVKPRPTTAALAEPVKGALLEVTAPALLTYQGAVS